MGDFVGEELCGVGQESTDSQPYIDEAGSVFFNSLARAQNAPLGNSRRMES